MMTPKAVHKPSTQNNADDYTPRGWHQEMEQQVMHGIANDLVNEIVLQLDRNGNIDTGELKNGIRAKIRGNSIILIMPIQGKFLEYGTNPHVIKTKDKQVLSDGKDFFGKEVHHPGTRPSPFIRPVLHQKLAKIIRKNIERHT